MMPLRRISLWAVFALAGMVAACTSPNPVLYTASSVPGPVLSGGPRVVVLQPVALASYLDRLQIVRSSESYRLSVMSNDWWGESPGPMLGRVLIAELGQRLPQSIVVNENGALTTSPDATIGLNIQRLDEDASGMLILVAQVGVDFRGKHAPALQNFHISVPTTGPTTEAEVAAISVAVGQLADGIAAMVVAGPGA